MPALMAFTKSSSTVPEPPYIHRGQSNSGYALNRVLFGEVEGTSASAADPAEPATITKLSDWLGRPREHIQLSEPESTSNSD